MPAVNTPLHDRVMAAWFRSIGIPASDATFQKMKPSLASPVYDGWTSAVHQHLQQSGLAGHPNPTDAMINQAVHEINQSVEQVYGTNVFRNEVIRRQNAAALPLGVKLLRGAGVVAGVGMIGHGLYGALNATVTDPRTGEHRRDWRKTVLGLGETAAGAGLSWASYVAGHPGTLRKR